MILIARIVDGRHLALTERIIERVVDLAGVDAKSRGGIPVDDQFSLEPLVLLIAVDVGELR
jgi:hypothetical protein